MSRGLSKSTSSYSDGEGRYPVIASIGPFIFCLHSKETAAWEGTNQTALCNNLQLWINHMKFTRTDCSFTNGSPLPFLLCRCPSASELISVMKHLICHTGATKRRLGGFYICLENHKNISTTSSEVKKHNLTTTTTWFTQNHINTRNWARVTFESSFFFFA